MDGLLTSPSGSYVCMFFVHVCSMYVLCIYIYSNGFVLLQIPSMAYRVLTPTTEGPPQAYIDDLVAEFEGLNMDNSSHHSNEYALAKKGKQQQRKRNKSRKLSGGETVDKNLEVEIREVETRLPSLERTLSVGSDVSGKSEDNFLAAVEEINKQAEENEKVSFPI